MKTAIIAVTEKGWETAAAIARMLPEASLVRSKKGVRETLAELWHQSDAIICVMAVGIVVRCISGLCQSKFTDPSVIVLDENGTHVVSLLSGHIGGANRLAVDVALITKGTAVITTASDVAGHTAVDLWAVENNLCFANPEMLSVVSARLLDRGTLRVFFDRTVPDDLPRDLEPVPTPSGADIVVSIQERKAPDTLYLVPRIRVIGFGCKRGTPVEEFEQVLVDLENNHGIDLKSIVSLASIDLKKDEKGLRELAIRNKWPIRFFSKEALNRVEVPSYSPVVKEKIGTGSVCEASALLAAGTRYPARLILHKIKWKHITAAIAEKGA